MNEHVCPNMCDANFITTAHVMQDWEVNSYGDYVKTINDCLQVTHKPDDDNIWSCSKCSAEAVIV